MLDLSDGLSGDAAQLAAASGVAVLLAAELIPVHPAVQQIASEREEVLRIAVGGGEDYELCFAAPAGTVYPFVAEFADYFGVRLTCVGRVGGGTGVWWSDAEGNRRPLAVDGYQHFRDRR
jgi:thiamine-monophosphate kinase